MQRLGSRSLWALLLAVILIGALWQLPLMDGIELALDWLAQHPVMGRAVLLGLFIVGALLLLPISPLLMGGGFVYGFVEGLVLVWLGTNLAALTAFGASRFLVRDWAAGRVRNHPQLGALDQALEDQAFAVVFLTRLCLFLPFNPMNLAWGLTAVRLRHYFLATALGMTPAVLLYTYLGSVAQEASEFLRDGPSGGPAQWLLVAGGILSLLLATLLIHRAATRALRARKLIPERTDKF